ncbi:MAG: hypothetical protein ACKOKC_13855 [Chthoniobacterales bacterium]
MKKRAKQADEMLAEYDFSKGVRGKYTKRFVSAPAKASGIFTVERFEEIMRKHGAVPLTAAERKKYAKFLKR